MDKRATVSSVGRWVRTGRVGGREVVMMAEFEDGVEETEMQEQRGPHFYTSNSNEAREGTDPKHLI